MLYLLHRGNHVELDYHGGQTPIVHLEASLVEVVAWANGAGRRWAFSLGNASANYAQFRTHLSFLDELNWSAIRAHDWRHPAVKEAKQAEFLLEGCFPFALVRRIGVYSTPIQEAVTQALTGGPHRPHVERLPAWYYSAQP